MSYHQSAFFIGEKRDLRFPAGPFVSRGKPEHKPAVRLVPDYVEGLADVLMKAIVDRGPLTVPPTLLRAKAKQAKTPGCTASTRNTREGWYGVLFRVWRITRSSSRTVRGRPASALPRSAADRAVHGRTKTTSGFRWRSTSSVDDSPADDPVRRWSLVSFRAHRRWTTRPKGGEILPPLTRHTSQFLP
jgi:hypothetical protein